MLSAGKPRGRRGASKQSPWQSERAVLGPGSPEMQQLKLGMAWSAVRKCFWGRGQGLPALEFREGVEGKATGFGNRLQAALVTF